MMWRYHGTKFLEFKTIRKDQQWKVGKAESSNQMKAPADCEADSGVTPYKLACLGLNRWPISDVSKLTFNRRL